MKLSPELNAPLRATPYIVDSFLSQALCTGSEFLEIFSAGTKKLPYNRYKLIANTKFKPEQKQCRIKD